MKLWGLFLICLILLIIHDGKVNSRKPNNCNCNCNCGAYSQLLLSNIQALLGEMEKVNKGTRNCLKVAKNCAEVLKRGGKQSGVYSIDPDCKGPFKVYCDQKTKRGGWVVFQRRQDGSVNFYRGWKDYKKGFGNLNGEFWLGLDKIYRLTHQTRNRLRVELEDFSRNKAYAEYKYFAISSEKSKYKLSLGTYSGTAGDSLTKEHAGQPFSTKDRDSDKSKSANCAKLFNGAWWYGGCFNSNLNGPYSRNGGIHSYGKGVDWSTWRGYFYSAKRTEMKIKPV